MAAAKKKINSTNMTEHDSPMLHALRGKDEDARRQVIEQLYERLEHHAAALIGRQQADLQPESVVQTVLVEAVERDRLVDCNDDAHLEARLKIAVKYKILDRKKKRRPGAMPSSDEGQADHPARGHGPQTAVLQMDEARVDEAKLRCFREACLSAVTSVLDRDLLNRYLFEEETWKRIAASLDTTPGAAKKKTSTAIRPRVLRTIVEPLRSIVDGRCWSIIDLHFAQRRSIESVAAVLNLEAGEVEALLQGEIQAAFVEQFGHASLPYLHRLLGRLRD